MFYRSIVSFAITATVLVTATAAYPQKARRSGSAAARNEPAACTALHSEYAMAGKRLAWAKVQGDLGGMGAAQRAEQESTNILTNARMTMDLLRSNGCRGPTTTPNRDAYLSQAIGCRMAMLQGGPKAKLADGTDSMLYAACEMEKWKP